MKIFNIEQFEKLKINSINLDKFNDLKTYRHLYFPKVTDELKEIIEERIKKEGNECDLNDIDVSNITDMGYIFYDSEFNGDISKWNVSNVINMSSIFYNCSFNGDISKWDVSNVTNMTYMFCQSNFDGDLSKWNVSNITNTRWMFDSSPLQNNPPKWYIKWYIK